MSKRQLVVTEQDPNDPQYGAMFALDPGRATGVGLPAFKTGSGLPAVGTIDGEAFFDTGLRVAYVWDGSRWGPIVPATLLTYPDDSALLSDTMPAVGSYAVSTATGNLFIKTATGWRQANIQTWPTEVALLATTNIGDGTVAMALDTGVLFSRVSGAWVPQSHWIAKEAEILARTTSLDGQVAVANDTGHMFTRAGGAWVGTPITHFPTEAALLAATPADGVLAWADDTGKVFGRSQGVWRYLTDSVVPTDNGIGTIAMFSVLAIPHSHLVCDGAKFDKALYPQLFAFLGTDTLPDLRDKFLRGWSAARPPLNAQDQSTSGPKNPFTTDQAGAHKHIEGMPGYTPYGSKYGFAGAASGNQLGGSGSDSRAYPYTSTEGAHSHKITGGGDAETRPANVAIVYAIQALPLTANALVKSAPPIIGWTQAMWAKNSVVVHNGAIWHALEDIPSTDTAPPAAPKWETLTGGGVTISATAPATPALGDLWLDPSIRTVTQGLNVWSGTEWVSFNGGNLKTAGGALPVPGYIDKRPTDTEMPGKVGGLALSTSNSGEILGLTARSGAAGFKYVTPPIGDSNNKRRIVMADDGGEPVWVDGCHKIADFAKTGSANHLLVENMHLYRKVEVEFILIPRGGDVDFKVLMDDASGTQVSWNGASMFLYGVAGEKSPATGMDKEHMSGGNSFFGMASCKLNTLWRIKLTYLRQEAEWSILHYEAMGQHPHGHIAEYRGYGEIQQTTPLHKLTTNTSGNLNIDVHGTAYGYM